LADLKEADGVDPVVVVSVTTPVSTLVAWIRAFGMTAPEGSVTIPLTPPVMVCAQVAALQISSKATAIYFR
jgi:hypothetical protein